MEEVYSPSLEGNLLGDPVTQPVKIYLPPGYDEFPDNRYPVVYLLHGHSQNYNTYYSSYGILNILNELISEKTIVPMIIVTPNGTNKFTGSMYTNSYASGNWMDFIVHDVVQFVENNYRILDHSSSRGLGGFSSGGYGVFKIAMLRPSLISSICTIGSSALNFSGQFLSGNGKQSIIEAAKVKEWNSNLPTPVIRRFSNAVAFAPDSTAEPVPGLLPYNEFGDLDEEVWQKWLAHDPLTMIQTHKDSLLKLGAIQMYIGGSDFMLAHNETFHQALLDNGIEHGYQKYSGEHNPTPVLDDMLRFFSDLLVGVVPTIRFSGEYYYEQADTLVAESDMIGKICLVPLSTVGALDSIEKYKARAVEVQADEQTPIVLTDLEFGKYSVYALSNDSGVSHYPGTIYLVPDKSPPALSLVHDTVVVGDSLKVSMNRNGTVYLLKSLYDWIDTLHTVSQIKNPARLIDSTEVLANADVSFNTLNLTANSYHIYGIDQYGIISEPHVFHIAEAPTSKATYPKTEIKIFPNPINEMVTIQVDSQNNYDIIITAVSGQQVFVQTFRGTEQRIDLSSLNKGVYILTYRTMGYEITRKIVKL